MKKKMKVLQWAASSHRCMQVQSRNLTCTRWPEDHNIIQKRACATVQHWIGTGLHLELADVRSTRRSAISSSFQPHNLLESTPEETPIRRRILASGTTRAAQPPGRSACRCIASVGEIREGRIVGRETLWGREQTHCAGCSWMHRRRRHGPARRLLVDAPPPSPWSLDLSAPPSSSWVCFFRDRR